MLCGGAEVTGLRIAVVGAGGVARYAHLPAYRRLGLTVTAVCDIDVVVAREVADEFGIEHVVSAAGALARREDVDVVDIATPPATHVELFEIFAAAGKPMLIQKPLCTAPIDLHRMEHIRAQHDPWIRLNLTGRHVSAWRTVADLLAAGDIGRPFLCTIRNRDWWDRPMGRWDHDIDNYIVFEMLIHHLDLCRLWFGAPRRIAARAGNNPAQRLQQPNWITAIIEYESSVTVQILEDWTMPEFSFATGHPFEEILINGDRGVIRANSERVELSVPSRNVVRTWHLARPGQILAGEQLTVNWFPDSFGQAMIDFLGALESNRGKAEDWKRLRDVTLDTFVAASATTADSWIECCEDVR